MLPSLTRFSITCTAFGAIAFGFVAAATIPAFAVDLHLSANCNAQSAINVQAPNTGIAFRKNPSNQNTQAASATVRRAGGGGNVNITVQGGGSTCFYAVQGNYSYCFQARTSNQINNINAVAGNNAVGNAPACQ